MKKSIRYLVLTAILIPILLALAVKLGTVNLQLGSYETIVVLDVLRLELAFYVCVILWSYLLTHPELKGFYWRIIFVLLLGLPVVMLNLTGMSASQVASESITMEKMTYYLSFLKYSWLNHTSIVITLLYLIPALVLASYLVLLVYINRIDEEFRVSDASIKSFTIFNLIAIVSLLVAFYPPIQKQLPVPLSYNPIVYVLKTGYFPKQEIVDYVDYDYPDWEFEKTESQGEKNIVLIILESVRSDAVLSSETRVQNSHLPESYYQQNVTPFLSSLTESSTLYTHAYATVPHTSKALVSIHCGILPFMDLPIYESTLGIPSRCLPEILQEQGYKTAYFQSPTHFFENRKQLTQEFGYQDFFSAEDFAGSGYERVNYLSFEDKVLLEPAEQWLKSHKSSEDFSPFLTTFLTGITHHNYQPPSYYEMKDYVEDLEFNAYLNSLRYTDEVVQALFDVYKRNGLYENSLFIIVGDHGEAFSEHGVRTHNNFLYNEVTNVFMLVHDPSNKAKTVVDKVFSISEILPKVMNELGFDYVSGGHKLFKKEQAIGACYEKLTCLMIVEDGYKYIFNFSDKEAELYDLKKDPLEFNNLAKQMPKQVEQMHQSLIAYYQIHRSAYDKFYRQKDPTYLSKRDETVLHSLDHIMHELNKVWPEQMMEW